MRATTEFFKDRDDDKVIPPGEGVMGVTLKARCPTCTGPKDEPRFTGPTPGVDYCPDPFHTPVSGGEGEIYREDWKVAANWKAEADRANAALSQAESERDEARYEAELMRQEKTALRLELDRALSETASEEGK